MFDCLPAQTQICIPAEYNEFWEFDMLLVRVPRPKLDGPVTIRLDGRDALVAEPIAHLSQKSVGNYVVFFTFKCPTSTSCRLDAAAIPSDRAEIAKQRGAVLRATQVASKDARAMDVALGKLRYCVNADCASGPSISFAELKAASADR